MVNESNRKSRKRGRPPGKNRPPFTEEEKRARNAQLERERRGDIADATAELVNEMNLETKVKLAQLLAVTITYFNREQSKKSIRDIQAKNQAMEAEVAKLEKLIAPRALEKDEKTIIKPTGLARTMLQPDECTSMGTQAAKRPKLRVKRRASEKQTLATTSSFLKVNEETSPMDPQTDGASDVGDILLSPEDLREFKNILSSRVVGNELPKWPPDDNLDLLLP